jgi:hypothetical protein
MVKTIAAMDLTKKAAQLQLLQLVPADMTSSSAPTDNAFQNHSSATLNQIVVTILMKSDVLLQL